MRQFELKAARRQSYLNIHFSKTTTRSQNILSKTIQPDEVQEEIKRLKSELENKDKEIEELKAKLEDRYEEVKEPEEKLEKKSDKEPDKKYIKKTEKKYDNKNLPNINSKDVSKNYSKPELENKGSMIRSLEGSFGTETNKIMKQNIGLKPVRKTHKKSNIIINIRSR